MIRYHPYLSGTHASTHLSNKTKPRVVEVIMEEHCKTHIDTHTHNKHTHTHACNLIASLNKMSCHLLLARGRGTCMSHMPKQPAQKRPSRPGLYWMTLRHISSHPEMETKGPTVWDFRCETCLCHSSSGFNPGRWRSASRGKETPFQCGLNHTPGFKP